MTFSIVQTAEVPGIVFATGGTTTATFTTPIGPGNMVAGFIGYFPPQGQVINGISDNKGNVYTVIGSTPNSTAVFGNNNGFVVVPFYLRNIQGRPTVLTPTTNSNTYYFSLWCAEITPSGYFDQALAVGNSSTGSPSFDIFGINRSPTLTPSSSNSIFLGFSGCANWQGNNTSFPPFFGGNWTTLITDVSAPNPPYPGPNALLGTQTTFSASAAQTVALGYLANDLASIVGAASIMNFTDIPRQVQLAQACVG